MFFRQLLRLRFTLVTILPSNLIIQRYHVVLARASLDDHHSRRHRIGRAFAPAEQSRPHLLYLGSAAAAAADRTGVAAGAVPAPEALAVGGTRFQIVKRDFGRG